MLLKNWEHKLSQTTSENYGQLKGAEWRYGDFGHMNNVKIQIHFDSLS